MQNENLNRQADGIKRNPSRFNNNVNQGAGNEKRFNEDNTENRSTEIYSPEGDSSNIDAQGSGVSDSDSGSGHQFGGGEATLERGFGSNQSPEQVSGGSPNSGSQIQKQQEQQQKGQEEQQQAQQQSGSESVSGNPSQSGAGASYGQQAVNQGEGMSPTSGTSGVDYGGGQRPNPKQAGGQSEMGTGGQGQDLMGEGSDQNRNSGTAPGSDIGELQNANRGGQQSGQFNQDQDDSRRQ